MSYGTFGRVILYINDKMCTKKRIRMRCCAKSPFRFLFPLLFIAFSCLLCQWWPFSSCFWINKLNLDMKIFWSVITACVWFAHLNTLFSIFIRFYIHDSSGSLIHFRLRFMFALKAHVGTLLDAFDVILIYNAINNNAAIMIFDHKNSEI